MTMRAAALALVLALTACGDGTEAASQRATPTPSVSPATTTSATLTPVEGVPVWYDDTGLHRGDQVAKTPVRLTGKVVDGRPERWTPHLALVRTGAVYRDPATDDIWFHPWDGRPRVVGHGSVAGPGGDPEGDVAAWFEGWHLVVYDTARGKVISRTRELAGVNQHGDAAEHLANANGFVHVSAYQVVWSSPQGLGRRDLNAGTTTLPWQPRPPAVRRGDGPGALRFVDVSAASAAWAFPATGPAFDGPALFVVDRPDQEPVRIRGGETPGRLSPDGSWLVTGELADGTHGVAVTDLDTGTTWKPFRKATYAFFSWGYGDALVMRIHPEDDPASSSLVACYPTRRACERLRSRGDVVLPNP